MAVADRNGLPIAARIASGERHETQLAKQTQLDPFVPARPSLVIGDKAYDSDKLDAELLDWGIELVAPPRRDKRRVKPKTQDGRRATLSPMMVNRTMPYWLKRYRRLTNRWDFKAENFLGFLHLGCLKTLLSRLCDVL